MAKKEVKVKSYRTKDGKRVKQSRRRIKIAAGVAGVAAVGGLIAAAKNKKKIGSLVNNARLKRSVFKDAAIPDSYSFAEDSFAQLNTPRSNLGLSINRPHTELDELIMWSNTFDAHFRDGPGSFFQTINPKTNKLETFVAFGADTGIPNKWNSKLTTPLTVVARVPDGVDPRGLDARAFQNRVKTDKKLRDAIHLNEELAWDNRSVENWLPGDIKKRDDYRKIILEALKDVPSKGKVNNEMVDIRREMKLRKNEYSELRAKD